MDARRTGDGNAQAAFYALDADEWRDTNRRMLHGRAEIAADLNGAGAATSFRLEIESITDLASNLALVDTQFFGASPSATGHASYLMVKRDMLWLIKSARISRYPEIPPSGATAAAEAVRAANDALLAAARTGNKSDYAKHAGDDLVWINPESGAVLSKVERLGALEPSNNGRTFSDVEVRLYSATAVVVFRSDWTIDGVRKSERVQRVFLKRNGQWQLIAHSATPIPASAR